MKYFFEDPKKVEELHIELESWLDTPFKHRCQVKGKGVDCINLVGRATKNVGVNVSFDFLPDYGFDWHLHNSEELLYKGIKQSCRVEDVAKIADIKNGDVTLYRFGKASAHSAIYCKGYVYHSVTHSKVTKSILKDPVWFPRLTHILRILK